MTGNPWVLGKVIALVLIGLYTTGTLSSSPLAAQEESLIYPVYDESNQLDPIDQGDTPNDWGNGEETLGGAGEEIKTTSDGDEGEMPGPIDEYSCDSELSFLKGSYTGDALELSKALNIDYEAIVTIQFLIGHEDLPCNERRDAIYVIQKANWLTHFGYDGDLPLGAQNLAGNGVKSGKKVSNAKLVKTCKKVAKRRHWIR